MPITKTSSGYETDKLLVNGLTSIIDLITDTAFTMTGGVANDGFVGTADGNYQLPVADGLLGSRAPVIAQATTNLLTAASDSSSFEGGTVGTWAVFARCTLANSAAQSYHGSKSMLMTSTSAVDNNQAGLNVNAVTAAGAQYTASAWFKGKVGNTYQIRLAGNVSGSTLGTSVTADGTWQVCTVTKTFDALDATRQIVLVANTPILVGDICYWDAIQLEQNPVATPYCVDSRTSCRMSIANPLVAGQAFSMLFLVQSAWVGTDGLNHQIFTSRGAGGAQNSIQVLKTNGNSLMLYVYDNDSVYKRSYITGVTAVTWPANTPRSIIVTRAADGTQDGYLNGVQFDVRNNGVGTGLETVVPAQVYLGTTITGTNPANGSILCAVWGRVLSAGEITALSSLASWSTLTDITVSGCVTGNAGRVYSGVTLIDSAVEDSGTITLTPSGTSRILRVYSDDTYTSMLAELEANGESIFGGDEFEFWAPLLDAKARIDYRTHPEYGQMVLDDTIYFRWVIPDVVGGHLHFKLQVADEETFASPVISKYTLLDQTGFEYWNGLGWVAFPSDGVDIAYAGNLVRYSSDEVGESSDDRYWRIAVTQRG